MAAALKLARSVSRQIGYRLESLADDDDGAQMTLAYMNEVCEELARLGSGPACWPSLRRRASFETVADQASYPLPDDFERILAGSVFHGQFGDEITEMNAAEEIDLETTLAAALQAHRYLLGVDMMRLWPVPAEAETVRYAYLSRNWVRRADGTPADEITADSDEILLNAALVRLGLRAELKVQREVGSGPVDRVRFERDARKKLAEALGVSRYPLWGKGGPRRGAGWPRTSGPLNAPQD